MRNAYLGRCSRVNMRYQSAECSRCGQFSKDGQEYATLDIHWLGTRSADLCPKCHSELFTWLKWDKVAAEVAGRYGQLRRAWKTQEAIAAEESS